MVLPVTVLSVLSGLAEARDPTVAAALSALTLPFSIWALIELGCLKGTTGLNRFGADPLSADSVKQAQQRAYGVLSGVQFDGTYVTVDVSDLGTGRPVVLAFDLIGGDAGLARQ